uniref:Protein phosphatase 2C 32 n=1 Tax=Cajanus cajan TaxID=3821 RepID=A0A151TXC9_CAJCA|nr:Protein phosphatase 2C 32 [Cajanus cajan]
MGNGTSRVVGCLVPFNVKSGVDLEFLEPLDEGLGHSFCYVRPSIFESPAITPSNSERFTVDSSTLDSETLRASVSANVSTARTGNQNALLASDVLEPAASFEGTSSFAAIPLQPVPRGSGPLNGFMSGPLERFSSGPLDKGGGFMSGPIEKGVMSGPLDATDKSNFSAPLARSRRRPHLQRLMRSVSGPMRNTFSRTFSKHSVGGIGSSELEYTHTQNLQWAHGKAGEDRVHVVLSEEQGWLFIGIYDGFSGPDAPDFLMSHLYKFIDKELEGLLWDYEDNSVDPPKSDVLKNGNDVIALECGREEMSDALTISNEESSCWKQMRFWSPDGKEDRSRHQDEGPTTSGENGGSGFNSTNQEPIAPLSVSGQRQNTRKSFIATKIRKMYRKQKSLRKKLFPWSYDWHREETCVDKKLVESSGPIRICKSGVDHNAVLRAMSQALERTEEAYMKMVENNLDKNPELALMGSCVLVMLMKDQDVYVMNLGDSRVILAQERPNDRHPNPCLIKDDMRHRNRSRESLVGMELDRISEESPVHTINKHVHKINKNREISMCRLKMRAVQLSTDHSTSIEEEVFRIREEHPDDNQAIFNDRVKGQLKVTRAFGAGFLKRPSFNEPLLKMFRVDYVGNAPYLSCTSSVLHHRLSSSDRFLVLSSDGLYQYFSNEEVVAHVTWFMENVPEGDPAQYLIAELLFRAAKKNGMDFHELLDIPHGDRRKYHDDVSVMVVSLEGRIWRSSG